MAQDRLNRIFTTIYEERNRQDGKWGKQTHPDEYWLGILMEELGEAAKSVIERQGAGYLYKELIQVAAVACAWMQCIEERDK